MAWRTGAALFADMWPVIQARITARKQRIEFTTALLRLMVEHDLDPRDVSDVHAEVRSILAELGTVALAEFEEDEPESVLALCVAQMGDPDPAARAMAAEAIRDHVPESDDPRATATAALAALIGILHDQEPKVRRAAAMSVRVLVRAGHSPTAADLRKLRSTRRHPDALVAKRVGEALAAINGRKSK